jgi:hypothetical protein
MGLTSTTTPNGTADSQAKIIGANLSAHILAIVFGVFGNYTGHLRTSGPRPLPQISLAG